MSIQQFISGESDFPENFNEEELQKVYNTCKFPFEKLFTGLKYIFETVDLKDPMFFRDFLRYNFDLIDFRNEHLKNLSLWKNHEYWELDESYCGRGKLLDLPDFPLEAIKMMGLDLKKILRKCKTEKKINVYFGEYF